MVASRPTPCRGQVVAARHQDPPCPAGWRPRGASGPVRAVLRGANLPRLPAGRTRTCWNRTGGHRDVRSIAGGHAAGHEHPAVPHAGGGELSARCVEAGPAAHVPVVGLQIRRRAVGSDAPTVSLCVAEGDHRAVAEANGVQHPTRRRHRACRLPAPGSRRSGREVAPGTDEDDGPALESPAEDRTRPASPPRRASGRDRGRGRYGHGGLPSGRRGRGIEDVGPASHRMRRSPRPRAGPAPSPASLPSRREWSRPPPTSREPPVAPRPPCVEATLLASRVGRKWPPSRRPATDGGHDRAGAAGCPPP